MPLFNTLKFNAIVDGVERWVLGSGITGIMATLAEGLYKAGNIDIDAAGNANRTVAIRNSGTGVANVTVDGSIGADGSITAQGDLIAVTKLTVGETDQGTATTLFSTATENRSVTLPDVTGDALVRNTADGVVSLIADTLFDVADAAADTSSGFFNSGVGQVCNLVVDGTIQFLTNLINGNAYRFAGTPTALRTITLPDSDVTIGPSSGYIGNLSRTAILAITPAAFAWAFCNDIAGSAGGTTGVPVYWTPVTAVWLRMATDGAI